MSPSVASFSQVPWNTLLRCGSGYTGLLHTDSRMDPHLCPIYLSCLELAIGQLQHARGRLICPGHHSRGPSRTVNNQGPDPPASTVLER